MTTTGLNQSDVNLLVYEAFNAGWQTYVPEGPKIFTRMKPERIDEKFSVHAVGGDIPQVAEGAAYPTSDVSEVGSKSFSHQTYKKAIPFTRLMKEYDSYGVVLDQAKRLGYHGVIAMDRAQADVLNNAEGTSTTWDGLALASTAHLIGDTGQVQSNQVTGAFSKANVNSCLVRLARQKDHDNVEMPLMAANLVVPPELQMDAFELLGSPDDPETANRSINYIAGKKIRLIVWQLLTSTTDYHVIADKMFNRLRYGVWLEPQIQFVRDYETGGYQYQIDFDCRAVAPDYLGYVHGNAA